jgi:hypothetical protein
MSIGEILTATRWLCICSVLSFFFAVGHTLGARKHWSPEGEDPVLKAMSTTHFEIEGVHRSYLDFYMGFGYSISVFQLMLAVLLWQLATLAYSNPSGVRPMIAVIGLTTALRSAISWRLIVPLPALFSLLLLGSLAVAYTLARKTAAIPVRRINIS